MDLWLRRATPLVLLVLAGGALLEPRLPRALRELLGEGGFTRVVVAVLCLYVILLIVERERMSADFKRVLEAFRSFHAAPAATRSDADAKREAITILVNALASDDAEVRGKAKEHLKRLTGEDFGEDVARWRAWLARGA